VVLDVVRAQDPKAAIGFDHVEDRMHEGKVRDDRVTPGDLLSKEWGEEPSSSRAGDTKVGRQPERRLPQNLGSVLRQEPQRASIDVLRSTFGPDLYRRALSRKVVSLPTGEGVDEHFSVVSPQRVDEGMAAEVPAALGRMDLEA
jgi:hypothetical protein